MTSTTDTTSKQNADLIRAGMHPQEATSLDRADTIALIRESLKQRSGKTWSVTGGRGTGYGWITIQAPPARRVAHLTNPDWDFRTAGPNRDGNIDANGNAPHTEIPADDSHGAYYMSEADCRELSALLGLEWVGVQGVNVAASSDYYREYVSRARGVEVLEFGTPYWD